MSALLSAFLDPTTLLLGGVLFLFLLWWLSTRRQPGLPPGPGPALPLLGHLHLLEKDPRQQFLRWRRQYGDVFSLYMGSRLVVVLVGYSAIREALVKMADVFSHRPHTFLTVKIGKEKGIFSTSGPVWKEQRKLSLEILRDLGMGKNMLADKIQGEIVHYVDAIQTHKGAPMDLARMTQVSISNNICSILFGKRYDYQDPEFTGCLAAVEHNFKLLAGTAILNFIPALEYVPGDPFKIKKILTSVDNIQVFANKLIHSHLQSYDGAQENRDYINSYIRQMCQQESQGGNASTTVNEEYLNRNVRDLFLAGTESTFTTLQWAMLFFLHYPEVQDKCYKEICDVIGPDRLPNMHDKQNLRYMEATIREVLRRGDTSLMSAQHAPSKDVNFRGYVIPKDAIIIPFLSSALQDPDVWGDPENFRPERFIGPDGKLTCPDEFIPFGLGRRVCLGESLAWMELFLYLTTLIQRFRFEPAEEGQLPPLDGVLGLTYSPQHFLIRAVPRAPTLSGGGSPF